MQGVSVHDMNFSRMVVKYQIKQNKSAVKIGGLGRVT